MSDADAAGTRRLAPVRGEVLLTVRVRVSGSLDPARSVADMRVRVAEAAGHALFEGMSDLDPELVGAAVVTRLVVGVLDQVQG